MAEDSGGEKTLPASGQKKQRAREDGNVARSQDLSSGATLAMALLTMLFFGRHILETLVKTGAYYLGEAQIMTPDFYPVQTLCLQVLSRIASCVLPFAAVMVATGIAMNLFQVGVLFTAKPLQPKLDKLNPLTGLKKFVSVRSLMELIKSLAKLATIGLIVWFAVKGRLDEFPILMQLTPLSLLPAVSGLIIAVWWRIAAAMIVIGIIDYVYQRWQRERDLRMTHQEAKQESKELEGDPHVKRRIRQLQRQLAAQRMMADVPTADVIITNPTHYAVAVRYDMAAMEAPVVVAKGARLVAERIRDIADENDVPHVQKPELARTMYRNVEVGEAIPESLFQAVAEVLSFVYQMDRRAEKQRERKTWAVA